MPTSKLKTLAIFILLAANLILLGLLVPDRIAREREGEALRTSLQQLYAAEQVTLDPSVVPDTVTIYALELGEDPQAREKAALALLGEDAVSAEEAGTTVFTADGGSLTLTNGSRCSGTFSGRREVSDLGKDAGRVLEAMGFARCSLGEPVRLRAGVYAVTATQSVLGVPVFSDGLTLTYGNGSLRSMEGVFLTGTAALTRTSDRTCISAADALVRFLSARFQLGWVGSAVTGLEQGYLPSETAAAVHLTPVWRLDTDTGSFYVHGLTGEVTAITE